MLKKVICHITLVTKLYILTYQQEKRSKYCSIFLISERQEQNIEKGLRQFITNKNIAALLKPFECTRGAYTSHELVAQIDPGKKICVTANEECWCLTKSTAVIVRGLHSNQEEADTKMLMLFDLLFLGFTHLEGVIQLMCKQVHSEGP